MSDVKEDVEDESFIKEAPIDKENVIEKLSCPTSKLLGLAS